MIEEIDVRRLTFLSSAFALNRARILVLSPKPVKIRGLGFRRSTEKYFSASSFSEWCSIGQAGFKGAILRPEIPHLEHHHPLGALLV